MAALTRLPHRRGATTSGPDEHRPVRPGRAGQNAACANQWSRSAVSPDTSKTGSRHIRRPYSSRRRSAAGPRTAAEAAWALFSPSGTGRRPSGSSRTRHASPAAPPASVRSNARISPSPRHLSPAHLLLQPSRRASGSPTSDPSGRPSGAGRGPAGRCRGWSGSPLPGVARLHSRDAGDRRGSERHRGCAQDRRTAPRRRSLMAVRMPGINGIEATRRITDAGGRSRVPVLTTFDVDEYVHAARRAGASGFLPGTRAPQDGSRARTRGWSPSPNASAKSSSPSAGAGPTARSPPATS